MLASDNTLTTPLVAEPIRSVLEKLEAPAVLTENMNARLFFASSDRLFQMLDNNTI